MSCIAHFHVLKEARSLLVACRVLMMRHTFTRECAEEAFDTGIVPAVAGVGRSSDFYLRLYLIDFLKTK
jgi:hypothetical protein